MLLSFGFPRFNAAFLGGGEVDLLHLIRGSFRLVEKIGWSRV
jgi:hypothetical protein